MNLSVVIPVYGRADLLADCLASVRRSVRQPVEIVVVDDGSPVEAARAIVAAAVEAGAVLLRQDRSGPAAARNRGARAAAGDVLVFLDSDVTVRPETLGQMAEAFEADAGLTAVFGSYDDRPSSGTRVSDYRNLLHHYVHQRSKRQAATFWSGCGAIRREAFLDAGGFDVSYGRPSIEDVELGLRLTGEGHRIELRREIQCRHAKRWTARSMFVTDLRGRAIPWTEMLLTHGRSLPRDLNFGWGQRLSVGLTPMLVLSLVLARGAPLAGGVAAAICTAALLYLNRGFLGFLARLRGAGFAAAAFPLHLLHYAASALGLAVGGARVWRRRDPRAWVAVGILFAAVAAAQIASGTYRADFTVYPDEPSHYVTGVMVAEFLRAPTLRPMHFAEQYYLHYPKVAMGHWPPLLYVLEGLWFAAFGSSKTAALILIGLTGFALTLLVYVLARRIAPFWAALASALLLAVTFPFQLSLDGVMADSLTALLALAAAAAFAFYMRQPGLLAGQAFGLLAAAALLTKGSACPLAILPPAAIVLARRFDLFRRWDLWLSAVPVLLLAVPWYAFAMRFDSVNSAAFSQSLSLAGLAWQIWTGYGPVLVVAAVGGALLLSKRDPHTAALAGLMLAFGLTPFAVKAFRESRHMLPAASAGAVLAAGVWARTRWPGRAAFGGLAAACAMSGGLLRLPEAQFRPWPNDIPREGTLLVSGSGGGEGAFIAAAAENSPRPVQPVVRASQALAFESWSGRRYRLLVRDAGHTGEMLTRMGAAAVVRMSDSHLPHDVLLTEATRDWKQRRTKGYTLVLHPDPPRRAARFTLEQVRLRRTIELDPPAE